MDWYWHVVIHIVAVYYTFGVYCGSRWSRPDEGLLNRTAFALFIGIFWLPYWESGDWDLMKPKKKTKDTQALRTERARMNKELETETAKVTLLEASVNHRQAMAELDERRKRAEEIK